MLRQFFLITVLTVASALLMYTNASHAANNALRYQYQINGLSDDLLKNVNSRLLIEQKSFGKVLTAEDVQILFKHSPEIIQKAIQPFGYFKSVVHSQLIQSGKTFIAKFNIQPGPAIRIKNIDVSLLGEGKSDPKLIDFVKNFPIKSQTTFDAESYENAKNQMLLLANEQGYIKASFAESKVLIDLNQYTVKIILHLDTNARYYVGKISYTQNAYDPQFLKRFTNNKKDRPFSSEKLNTLQQNLMNSYYFQEAYVTPDFDNIEDYHVPININVVPPKAKRYSIGVGYGTLTGPRFSASLDLRRLTTTGHHFETQLKLSEVLSGLSAKYYIPGKNPFTDEWMFSANYQKFSPNNGMSYSKTLSAGYNNKWHHLRSNISINYLIENFKVESASSKSSKLLYPKLNLYYVDADDLINPHRGHAIDLMLQGGSKGLLSSSTFIQAELKGKYILGLNDYNRFIFRGDIGYSIVKNLNDLPLTMRFFVGGLNTLRGYKDSSIGPGRYLKAFSIEYQNRIVGKWNGALFYDAATASNHFDAAFKTSQGVGLIYESFIGPVKFYVAHASNKPGKSFGIEFSIGPEF